MKTAKIKIIKFLNNLLILSGIVFVSHKSFSDSSKLNDWGASNAKIEVENVTIEKMDVDNTVFGTLVKESGKQLNELLDTGTKIVKTFKIIYPVLIKKDNNTEEKKIEQYGIVKTLPTKIQEYINKTSNAEIPIQYKINDPIVIRFVINGATFDAPVLLTDFNKIDKK